MLSKTWACEVVGLEGHIVEVETDFNPNAFPAFIVVGLPDTAVQESKERVRAAIKNTGLRFPMKRFVVNMAPADLRKEGPAYDLAIAVGCLAATDQVPLGKLEGALFVGELSLDGSLRHVGGILPIVHKAQQAGFARVYVPADDAPQAALVPDIEVIPVPSLGHLVEHLYELNVIPPYRRPNIEELPTTDDLFGIVDFEDIKGQIFSLPVFT